MSDVCYVTCRDLPDDRDLDQPVALAALRAAGLSVEVVPWDATGHRWSEHGLVLVRSTWDYTFRRDEFLQWAAGVAAVTRLANPAEVLVANTDKRYLHDLAEAGVPVVPTWWAQADAEVGAAVDAALAGSGGVVVVKPHVSASARDTVRTRSADAAGEQARRILASGRVAMVQPYLVAVEAEGETSVVLVDGEPTHAVAKRPALTTGGHGGAAGRVGLTDELRAAAADVLAAAGARDLLYARVDLVRDDAGRLVLMELELTEPSLFLPEHPPAADRLAAGIVRRLG